MLIRGALSIVQCYKQAQCSLKILRNDFSASSSSSSQKYSCKTCVQSERNLYSTNIKRTDKSLNFP